MLDFRVTHVLTVIILILYVAISVNSAISDHNLRIDILGFLGLPAVATGPRLLLSFHYFTSLSTCDLVIVFLSDLLGRGAELRAPGLFAANTI